MQLTICPVMKENVKISAEGVQKKIIDTVNIYFNEGKSIEVSNQSKKIPKKNSLASVRTTVSFRNIKFKQKL